MAIDLRKRIVDLSKKAAFAANKHGIEGHACPGGVGAGYFSVHCLARTLTDCRR
ncbi:MAG: hypothetical protein KDI50_02960 [Candidatus Competibacteraceae bacterium]|nr:hypothetical protein [Candidatus Competibacteraceae bacterium]